MFGLGFSEILMIGVLLFLVFGAKRLPELGSSLARGIKNFQKGLKDEDRRPDEISQVTENKKDQEK
jgi:sec-independent protein translocase protein TatA